MTDKDRFLAEKVMGWFLNPKLEMDDFGRYIVYRYYTDPNYALGNATGFNSDSFHPSTDITQALGDGGPGTVVGEMNKKKNGSWNFMLIYEKPEKIFRAIFWDGDGRREEASANIPADAITTAACKARGMEGI